MKYCPAEVDAAKEAAMMGGLQEHSIGGPYPWIVVGIENPLVNDRVAQGTFYYVQNPDGTIGSLLYNTAEGAAELASCIKRGVCQQTATQYHYMIVYDDVLE